MNICILGATGHIGGALAAELVRRDHEVTAVTRNPTGVPIPGVDVLRVQGYSTLDIARLVEGFDWLIDAAAPYPIEMATSPEVMRAHERSARSKLQAVRSAGVGLVYLSSFVTLLATQRAHPYYVLKKRLEQLVLDAVDKGLTAIVVNPPACFGPYDNKPSQLAILAALAKGQVPMLLDGKLRFIDVRNLAADVVSAIEVGATVGPAPIMSQTTSLRQIAATVSGLTGVAPPEFVSIPPTLARWSASLNELSSSFFGVHSPLSALSVLLLTDSMQALRGHPLPPAVSRYGLETTVEDSLDWYYRVGCLKPRPAELLD